MGGHLVQLQLKSPSFKSKSTSAIASVDLELDSGDLSKSVGGHLVQLQLKSPSSSPPSSHPPTVGLILKFANSTVVSVTLVLRAVIVYIELSQVSMMSSFPFSEALMCSSVGRRRDSCKMAAGLGLAG